MKTTTMNDFMPDDAYQIARDPNMSDELKLGVLSTIREIQAETRRDALEKVKWRWSTPLAVALTGLITLTANFAFNYLQSRGNALNQADIERQKSELEKENTILKAKIDESSKITFEEKKFQFEIVLRELADKSKDENDRAKTLLFLARAGVLSNLAVDELRTMAEASLGEDKIPGIPTLVSPTAPDDLAALSRDEIRKIQRALCMPPSMADGVFGSASRVALLDYQRRFKPNSVPSPILTPELVGMLLDSEAALRCDRSPEDEEERQAPTGTVRP